MKRTSSLFAALLVAFAGCGGKAEQYQFSINIAGAPTTGGHGSMGGGAPSFAADPTSGGESMTSAAGDPSSNAGGGGESDGGAAGSASSEGGQATNAGGAAGSPSQGGAAGSDGSSDNKVCASVSECPRPSNMCLTARCAAGSCLTENVAAGSLYVLDAPADCHATTACDGLGHPTLTVDQSNWPTPSNPCLTGTCNAAGVAGTEPVPKGTRCSWDFGRGKCDGNGTCATCLETADCPLGELCNVYHACVGRPCSDVVCGGACPACVDENCAKDGDCASNTCDPATLHCVANQICANHQQDGNETDTDCGGSFCPRCAAGQACLDDSDCGSLACDAIARLCVQSNCVDHQKDSDESDVDCGGTNAACKRCDLEQKCNSNVDCNPGHTCPLPGTKCQ